MSALHKVSAILELGAGVALLCIPSTAVSLLLGVSLEIPSAVTVARVGGSALFALGIACWLASAEPKSRAAVGVIAAMLFYNVTAAAALAFAAISYKLHAVALWPAVALHAAMAVWCIIHLRPPMRPPT